MSLKNETASETRAPQQKPGDGDRAAAIARRAYEKWQARGCPEGDDCRDWFEAEQEVYAAIETSGASGGRDRPARTRVTS